MAAEGAWQIRPQGANIAAAARYLQEKYGLKITSAQWARRREEEAPMGSSTRIAAPANPYRQDGRLMDGWASLAGGPVPSMPPRHDTVRGPGLTGADIDRLCRDHFAAGHATRDREAQDELADLRAQLATAFDEGYTAGRVERAQGLARDFHVRCMEPALALTRALEGPKVGARARTEEAKAALDEVMAFAAGLTGREDEDRIAAQVARDER